MCDFCFMKSLILHFTHLRSLFSLINCWLILSRVISLTPLDLQNLSIPNPSRSSSFELFSAQSQGEPESPAQGPDTPALRPDTPGSKMFLYIPRGGRGKRLLTSFSMPTPPSPFSSPSLSHPRGDFYLPSIM